MSESKEEKPVSQVSPVSFYNQTREIIKNCGINTTAHAIPNICQTNSWPLRIFWLGCLLTGSGYSTYLVIDVVFDYLNYPVVTNFEVVDELTTTFPTLLFCNLNPFNNDLPNTNQMMNEVAKFYSLNKSLTTSAYSSFLTEVFKSYMNKEYELRPNLLVNWTHQLHMNLISCSFGSTSCSLDDFELIYTYDYLICYKFNSDGTKTVSRRGYSNGLQLELYIGNSSSPDDAIYFGSRGIRFMVYNSSLGDGFIKEQGQDAAPGFVTNNEVIKKFYDRLSSPYSDCLDDLTPQSPDQTKTMKIMFEELNQTKYNQIYCQNVCLHSALINDCGCFFYSYPYSKSMIAKTKIRSDNTSFCLPDDYYNCALPTIQSLSTDGSVCKSECKKECEYFTYESTYTIAEHMTHWYWSHLKNYSRNYVAADNTSQEIERQTFFKRFSEIATLAEARDSTLKLNVFLGHIGYYSTSESPFYSFNSLLGSVGGQLGLFLGVSLLSFMELVEMAYLIFEMWLGRLMVEHRQRKAKIEAKPKMRTLSERESNF